LKVSNGCGLTPPAAFGSRAAEPRSAEG
jgi:hypothetical protein